MGNYVGMKCVRLTANCGMCRSVMLISSHQMPPSIGWKLSGTRRSLSTGWRWRNIGSVLRSWALSCGLFRSSWSSKEAAVTRQQDWHLNWRKREDV